VRAGYCAACEVPIWKIVAHPVTGAPILLWPRPDSVYAKLGTATGWAPGVGYCTACCPPVGALTSLATWAPVNGVLVPVSLGAVVGHETAGSRYRAWYSDHHGEFLRNWLRDGNGEGHFFNEVEIEAVMAEWEQDRAAVMTMLVESNRGQ
jgi:hypothetical protein